jgi:hypothetical protein
VGLGETEEAPMPADAIVFLSYAIACFVVFGVTLGWTAWRNGR